VSRILVIIPAYNEEASLEHVVKTVRACVPAADIAVVNDGSRDRTPSIIEGLDVIALHLPYRVGVGPAEQTGFRYALRLGYDVVVRNDGDGQHNPAEIPQLLDALRTTDADVVIGSRYLEDRGYVTPRLRYAGIAALAGLVSLLAGARFTDPTSGFRAFSRRAVRFCAAFYPSEYPEPESIVLCTRAGLRVREIPVTMNPRFGGQSSIRTWSSVAYMIKVVLALVMGMLRQAPGVPPEVP
jgi:glycosyltransferase involved in cell wall biosynthesis